MFTIRTILVPTDFSERAEYALGVACSLAQALEANLVLVHVAGRSEPAAEMSLLPRAEEVNDALWDKLNAIRPAGPQVSVSRHLRHGHAGEEILLQAAQSKADLIVMGTHGRTGLGRLLMGSVAEEVVRNSACPVLTVKLPLPASGEQV
jgi:nucleotide-binding universal stress UspA family protein